MHEVPLPRTRRFSMLLQLIRRVAGWSRKPKSGLVLEASRLLVEGSLDEAEFLLRTRFGDNSADADVCLLRGQIEARRGRVEKAAEAFQLALGARPDFAEAHGAMGDIHSARGETSRAIQHYRQAILARPDVSGWHNNLGLQLFIDRGIDEAVRCFRRALSLEPDLPEAHVNLGMALLVQGDFENGWPEYEWRPANLVPAGPQAGAKRNLWDGSPLMGASITVTTEQGFGDTLLLARLLPRIRALGGTVSLRCTQKPLLRLLEFNHLADRLVDLPGDDETGPELPMASLPYRLGLQPGEIPGTIPYISADPSLVAGWRERLPLNGRLRVGVAWAGNPRHSNDRFRSLRLSDLDALKAVSGVDFYSLQKDLPGNTPLPDWLKDISLDLGDFADTAAVLDQLDLLISVDTAVVHLAGAMGKPVWLLAPRRIDWRWEVGGRESPWYPSVRMFAQRTLGDWLPEIDRIAKELAAFAADRACGESSSRPS